MVLFGSRRASGVQKLAKKTWWCGVKEKLKRFGLFREDVQEVHNKRRMKITWSSKSQIPLR